jgi:hypothetical protein
MKQFVFFIMICCMAVACKKSGSGSTKLALYNATHSIAALSASWSGIGINANPLAQAQSSGSATTPYVQLPAGTNNIVVTAGSRTFFDKNAFAAFGNAYTLLVYDTSSADSTLNTLLLTDDLTLPDTASAKCRFINCVPDTMSINFFLVNKVDTFAIQNASFIGRIPLASSVQPFGNVKRGTYKPYLVQAATRLAFFTTTDSITLTRQSIYSFIYSGLKTGTGARGIKFNIINHPAD